MPETRTPSPRQAALSALRSAFAAERPDIALDAKGYAPDHRDLLLTDVLPEDFAADLAAGDGNELQGKMRAVHSSSALVVNSFAPFRRNMSGLVLPGLPPMTGLAFERKCPTGLRGGRAPNLDLLLDGPEALVGVESKLTEYLTPHAARFSPAYPEQITDWRRDQGYFAEMQRLRTAPDDYRHLDAAQLVKHAFGLGHVFGDQPVTLVYLYWEPVDAAAHPVFAAHRAEISAFAARVAGSVPAFAAMDYPTLWQAWRGQTGWVGRHADRLLSRYGVRL